MDILKSFISLLALIDPVGAAPFFLSIIMLLMAFGTLIVHSASFRHGLDRVSLLPALQ
jgi:hypothetical protein